MSLRLLVDEDLQARVLVRRLRSAGHDVVTVADAGLMSLDDTSVLQFASEHRRVLLTRNAADFAELHVSRRGHEGILAVFQDREPAKNMTYEDIVEAVGALEQSGIETADEFVVLNAWKPRRR